MNYNNRHCAAEANRSNILWANEQCRAAWAGYEEDEIPDRPGPVLIGRCETTLVVRQKAVNGNPDRATEEIRRYPARCLNLGLGKRGNYVEFRYRYTDKGYML